MTYRVLIVEDDPQVATINRHFTERVSDFTVVAEVRSTERVVAAVDRHRPDLILLDVYFPAASGLQVLRQIRQGGPPVDVIFITAAQDPVTIQEALRLGAVDYLIKPFLFERFQQALLTFCRRREQLGGKPAMGQGDVDAALAPLPPSRLPLPKGLSALTLQKVVACLQGAPESLTAEAIAGRVQVSRVTAWRYLDYLAGQGRVGVEVTHGGTGRPLQKYYLVD